MPMMLSATFEIFDRLQKAGDIPAGVKYQIDMATPLAITYNFMVPSIYESFRRASIPIIWRRSSREYRKACRMTVSPINGMSVRKC